MRQISSAAGFQGQEIRTYRVIAMTGKFIKVKCPDCGNEQVIFERAATVVKCTVCGAVLAEPRGGKAVIKGEKLEEMS